MESKLIVESRRKENLRVVQDGDRPLLAVAIAATLVEYQRYVERRADHDGSKNAKTNWQTVVRLEQLRGRG
jgi:hypothetical protein